VQLEMAQSAYMQEDSAQWDDALAQPVQTLLQRLVQVLLQWKPEPDEA
jgi:N-formylglutamate amidohydrolase